MSSDRKVYMKKKLESMLKQLAYDLKYILVSSFIFRCLIYIEKKKYFERLNEQVV